MKKIKEWKLFDYHFIYLFVTMVTIGVGGFIIECFATGISKGYIDSRFQRLPCILGYGIVVILLYLVFGTPNKMRFFQKEIFRDKKSVPGRHFLYFLIVTLFIFLGEWGAGELFEWLTGAVLWNYSDVPLHIGKYVCLPFTLGFGAGAYVFMAFIFTPFMNLLESKMSPNAALVLCFVIGVPAVVDCLTTGVILACGKAPKILWRINFPWYKKTEASASLARLLLK